MNRDRPETPPFRNQHAAGAWFVCGMIWKARMVSGLRYANNALGLCLVLLMGACASTTQFERPDPFDTRALRDRAETVTENGVRVSAAVPSRSESRAIFGIDPAEKNIEPLWLEIENNTDRRMIFLPTGLDPEYFSPLEVAFGYHKRFAKESRSEFDAYIENLGHPLVIDPHSTESGFVFTNRDKGTKIVNVDLLAGEWTKSFMLVVPTPDSALSDTYYQDVTRRVAQAGWVDVEDESRLREMLEQLPCCTTGKDGRQGEPLNVVLIGALEAIAPAFVRRNFRYTPVPPWYAFERAQDISASKRDRWVASQPHVMRAWLTTIRFRGYQVWLGQVSTPLGGRFAGATADGTDPPIDPDVDEARNDLTQDMIYSQSLVKIGFVKGVGQVKASQPRKTRNGGYYHTDGLRAVLVFERRPVPLSGIEFFDWERLIDHYRKQVDTGEVR